jgi:hypothetical protein
MKQIIADEYIQDDGSIDIASLRHDLFDYFNTLHYMLSDTEFDLIARHALGWIQDHLADHNVFEDSIRSKAREISSGDHHGDYYRALILRRDQLLAARDVFREYTSRLREIFSDDREQVLASLHAFNFEEGIYLRATEYAQARDQAVQDFGTLLDGEIEEIESAIENEEQILDLETADRSELEKPVRKPRLKKSEDSVAEKKPRSRRYFHRNI